MFTVTSSFYVSSTAGVASFDIAYPATITAGDLLFLFVSIDSNGNVNTPAGWNVLHGTQNSNSGRILWKRADGTETGNLNVTCISTEPTVAAMYRVHSSVTNKPLFRFLAGNFANTPAATPAITLPWEPTEALFISAVTGFSSNYDVSAFPTGYDIEQIGEITPASGSTSYTGLGVSAKYSASSNGDTPSAYNTTSGVSGVGITIAVYDFQITNFAPSTKLVDQLNNSNVRVTGDISGGVGVEFDGVAVDPSKITIYDANNFNVVTPVSAVAGTADITVIDTVNTLEDTLVDGLTYLNRPPTITSVTPAGSIVDDTGSITITGSYFRAGVTVEIDGVPCTSVVVVNPNTITANFPVSSVKKTATLVVENDDAQFDSTEFFYMDETPVLPPTSSVTATFEASAVRYVK